MNHHRIQVKAKMTSSWWTYHHVILTANESSSRGSFRPPQCFKGLLRSMSNMCRGFLFASSDFILRLRRRCPPLPALRPDFMCHQSHVTTNKLLLSIYLFFRCSASGPVRNITLNRQFIRRNLQTNLNRDIILFKHYQLLFPWSV